MRSSRPRGRVRIKLLALVALAFGLAIAWAFWPETHRPAGPSISERAKQGGVARSGGLSARVISDEDLPPEGTRSLFDHLLVQNDGLPFPFGKLVALLQAQHPEGKAPVSLMIPLGRSLLKAQANFGYPRVLVAADFHAPNTAASLGLAPRGQLFLGFVENAREIEVISYNEAAGRFEFQLVQNYCDGCVPRIVYARRAICTTCHQGAAPIFPQRPWNETNAQPEISSRIVEARRGAEPYLGLPVANTLAAPERFDELTDVANFFPVAQRLWLDGCGDGAAGARCRKQLLRTALLYLWNPGDFRPEAPEATLLRELQAQAWAAQRVERIAVPESDIANRDPIDAQRGVRGFIRKLFTHEAPPEGGAKTNEDLEAFEKLPKLPPLQDPVTPRPPKRELTAQDLDGAFGLAQFFSVPDVQTLEAAAGHEWPRLAAALDEINPSFFGPAAFSRVRTMNAVLGVLGAGAAGYCCLDTAEMSPPVAAGAPPLALTPGSPLHNFEQYCFACHRGNPARRLDFMAGATEQAVLDNIRARGEIRDALDWERYLGTAKAGTLMPPEDSRQRAMLEQAVAKDPQVLVEMRNVVPGLFDF